MKESGKNLTKKDRPAQIDYAIGVLETIQFLINTRDESLLNENIDHAKVIIPKAIDQLNEI